MEWGSQCGEGRLTRAEAGATPFRGPAGTVKLKALSYTQTPARTTSHTRIPCPHGCRQQRAGSSTAARKTHHRTCARARAEPLLHARNSRAPITCRRSRWRRLATRDMRTGRGERQDMRTGARAGAAGGHHAAVARAAGYGARRASLLPSYPRPAHLPPAPPRPRRAFWPALA